MALVVTGETQHKVAGASLRVPGQPSRRPGGGAGVADLAPPQYLRRLSIVPLQKRVQPRIRAWGIVAQRKRQVDRSGQGVGIAALGLRDRTNLRPVRRITRVVRSVREPAVEE